MRITSLTCSLLYCLYAKIEQSCEPKKNWLGYFYSEVRNGGRSEKNQRLSGNRIKVFHLWGSCSKRCPDRKSNDHINPWAGLLYGPLTWVWFPSASGGDVALLPLMAHSFRWWPTPSCLGADLVSAELLWVCLLAAVTFRPGKKIHRSMLLELVQIFLCSAWVQLYRNPAKASRNVFGRLNGYSARWCSGFNSRDACRWLVPFRILPARPYFVCASYVGLVQVMMTAITGANPSNAMKVSTIKMTAPMLWAW